MLFSLKCMKQCENTPSSQTTLPLNPSSTLQTLSLLSTHHNDSLTLQITTQKLNGLNQPNFSLKVKERWAISWVPNQNPTPMIHDMNYGMRKIPWSCLGYYTPCSWRLAKHTCFSPPPKRFEMLSVKHIPRLE